VWSPEYSKLLRDFVLRSRQRTFADGPIANLLIHEYWHQDIPPASSEQLLTFYKADLDAFATIESFATIAFLFNQKDGLTEAARNEFGLLDSLSPIAVHAFKTQWDACNAKVATPTDAELHGLNSAALLTNDWNDKMYFAQGVDSFFSVCWSTTA
jgi:hypothetical protein